MTTDSIDAPRSAAPALPRGAFAGGLVLALTGCAPTAADIRARRRRRPPRAPRGRADRQRRGRGLGAPATSAPRLRPPGAQPGRDGRRGPIPAGHRPGRLRRCHRQPVLAVDARNVVRVRERRRADQGGGHLRAAHGHGRLDGRRVGQGLRRRQADRGHQRLVRAGSGRQRLVLRRGDALVRGRCRPGIPPARGRRVSTAPSRAWSCSPTRWVATSTARSSWRARPRTSPSSATSRPSFKVPAGSYENVLVTEEWTPARAGRDRVEVLREGHRRGRGAPDLRRHRAGQAHQGDTRPLTVGHAAIAAHPGVGRGVSSARRQPSRRATRNLLRTPSG